MTKRIFCLILCAVLLCCSIPAALADEESTDNIISISTAQELIDFAENCRLDSYSRGISVRLENDIDLSGSGFFSIPSFSGSFDGAGHTVSGIEISADGSVQGFFRYIEAGALVQNLKLQAVIAPAGSRSSIGGIAGSNAGSIINCSFDGIVSGAEHIGGIAGKNTVSGIIENCSVSGSISGLHFVGGIAGENLGVIRGCENLALINTTEQENLVGIEDLSIESLMGSEYAATVTDIGGIAGISHGVIRSCTNRGDVGYKLMGYNIGGISGSQSGYITACENHAFIQGRKDVGGIAGQLEPVALVEYTEDTLQILQTQLDAMGGTVNYAGATVQNAGAEVEGQMGQLEIQTNNAIEAIEILRNPQDYDPDSVLAAESALTNSLNDMGGTVQNIGSIAAGALSSVGNTLSSLEGQINAMSNTLSNAEESSGLELNDVSDLDTENDLGAKIELCTNFGSVNADANAGGISGAISPANDLDSENNFSASGTETFNINAEYRAVVLLCRNEGEVSAKKQNVGGITGMQSMGLVRSCVNVGNVDSTAAEYVGGISGISQGFIRSSYANSLVSGDCMVGGIAGSAAIVSDCISLVQLDGREKLGEVLGIRSESEEENPIRSNFYLSDADKGGIDGISYDGLAQPLSLEEFLLIPSLPLEFREVQISFISEDGSTEKISLPLGGALTEIPSVPEKANHAGEWAGLSEAQLDRIFFDMSFEASYIGEDSVIDSTAKRDSGVAVMLLQGSFTSEAKLELRESSAVPQLPLGEKLVEVWDVSITEGETVCAVRYNVPENCETENAHIMVKDSSGQWKDVSTQLNGSYLVFETDGDISAICLKLIPNSLFSMLSTAGGITLISIVVLVIVISACLRRQKKKKQNS